MKDLADEFIRAGIKAIGVNDYSNRLNLFDNQAMADNDTIYGGANKDFLQGSADSDSIYGGGGDDVILGDGNIRFHQRSKTVGFRGDFIDFLNILTFTINGRTMTKT